VLRFHDVEAGQEASRAAVARVPNARWQAQRRWATAEEFACERAACEASVAVTACPAHAILRVEKDVGTLRRRDAYHAIRVAVRSSLRRRDFRVVHISLQDAHVHLVVEADDERALARGMRGLDIAMARRLNAAISGERRTRRSGRVFSDRYHARILRTPADVRNVIGYVLNNWRHHGEDRSIDTLEWHVDYFSSGPTFDGWAEPRPALPSKYQPLETSPPSTWLLRTGWKRGGPISTYAVPGRDCHEGRAIIA
jgi:REP element-mobilizing transposase RayT